MLLLVALALVWLPSGSAARARAGGLGGGYVGSLVIDPTNPRVVYASTVSGGVFKSADGGRRWRVASAGLTEKRVDVIAIDPQSPATLYAGTGVGVFKSTDHGRSWQLTGKSILVTTRDGLRHRLAEGFVYSLAVGPINPRIVYAGTSDSGVLKSADGGQTWHPTGLRKVLVQSLVIEAERPAIVYAGVFRWWPLIHSDVFKSINSGRTWQVAEGGRVGLHRKNSAAVIASAPLHPATLYAGVKGGIYKTVDRARTWRGTGLPTVTVAALAIDPSGTAIVYAGTNKGVFKTADGGQSWSATGLDGKYVGSLAIDPRRPATVYAGTGDGQVAKTTDGGNTWTST